MKILIGQPTLEKDNAQLENDMRENPDVDAILYSEGYLNENLEEACSVAKKYNQIVISGYRNPKDRAVVISRHGEILLDRAKYDEDKILQWRI